MGVGRSHDDSVGHAFQCDVGRVASAAGEQPIVLFTLVAVAFALLGRHQLALSFTQVHTNQALQPVPSFQVQGAD